MTSDISLLSFLHLPSLLIGVMGGVLLLAAFLVPYLLRLERERAMLRAEKAAGATAAAAMDDHFKTAAMQALQTTQAQFLTLAQERLSSVQKDASFDLEKRHKAIADLVDPIGKTLKEVEGRLEILGQAGAVLDNHLKNFAEDQKLLRAQTASLVQVLRNSGQRGRWGEMQLARTLELVGMVENVHFRQQVSVQGEHAQQRPDFILHLPGHLSIVVDVKTPLEPYWALADHDGMVPAADDAQLRSFRDHLRNHVKQLSTKEYWRQFDSPQFVIMFLPTEGLFSLAVNTDKTLIEDAAAAGVILASPTTILGLLRVVMHAWAQQALAENAREIGKMSVELNGRMRTFFDHLQKLGRNLGTAVNAYNSAIGTAEARIMPQLRKIEEFQGEAPGDWPELAQLEHTPRDIVVPPSDERAA